MHTDSRMAPQQPRNEMNTTREPRVIIRMGIAAWGGKPVWPLTSMVPTLCSMITPNTMPKMPIICKIFYEYNILISCLCYCLTELLISSGIQLINFFILLLMSLMVLLQLHVNIRLYTQIFLTFNQFLSKYIYLTLYIRCRKWNNQPALYSQPSREAKATVDSCSCSRIILRQLCLIEGEPDDLRWFECASERATISMPKINYKSS